MPKKGKLPPALKNYVIEAIAALQERRGSSTREILNQIKTMIRRSPRYKERSRNLMLQIQRALRYCVEDGLLRHRAGRYKLGIKNDKIVKIIQSCQITKDNPKTKPPDQKIEEGKGNKKKRRRTSSVSTSSTVSGSSAASSIGDSRTSSSSDGSRSKSSLGEPNEARRRRKGKQPKGKKKGRKGRKRRRRSVSHSEDSQVKNEPPNHPDKSTSEQKQTDSELASTSFSGKRRRLRGGRSNEVMDGDANSYPDCGSPDCLCNAVQEQNDSTQTREDDYIN